MAKTSSKSIGHPAKGNFQKTVGEAMKAKPAKIQTSKFKCGQCGSFFVEIDRLRLHLESAHGIGSEIRKSQKENHARKETQDLEAKKKLTIGEFDQKENESRNHGFINGNRLKDFRMRKKERKVEELSKTDLTTSLTQLQQLGITINPLSSSLAENQDRKLEDITNQIGKKFKDDFETKTLSPSYVASEFEAIPKTKLIDEVFELKSNLEKTENFAENNYKTEIEVEIPLKGKLISDVKATAKLSPKKSEDRSEVPPIHKRTLKRKSKFDQDLITEKISRLENGNKSKQLAQLQRQKTNSVWTVTKMPRIDQTQKTKQHENGKMPIAKKTADRAGVFAQIEKHSDSQSFLSGESIKLLVEDQIAPTKAQNVVEYNQSDKYQTGITAEPQMSLKRKPFFIDLVEENNPSKSEKDFGQTGQLNKSQMLMANEIQRRTEITKSERHSGVSTSLKCRKCSILFKEFYILQQHIQIAHSVAKVILKAVDSKTKGEETKNSGRQSFDCKECKADLSTAEDVEKHIYNVDCQAKLTNLRCPFCQKKLKNKYTLKQHLICIHPRKEDVRACCHCQKQFSNKYLLKQHLKKAHKSGKGKCKKVSESQVSRDSPKAKIIIKRSEETLEVNKRFNRRRSKAGESHSDRLGKGITENSLVIHSQGSCVEKKVFAIDNSSSTNYDECVFSSEITTLMTTNVDVDANVTLLEAIEDLAAEGLSTLNSNFDIESGFDDSMFDFFDENSTLDNELALVNEVIEDMKRREESERYFDKDDSTREADEEFVNQSFSTLFVENPYLVDIINRHF